MEAKQFLRGCNTFTNINLLRTIRLLSEFTRTRLVLENKLIIIHFPVSKTYFDNVQNSDEKDQYYYNKKHYLKVDLDKCDIYIYSDNKFIKERRIEVIGATVTGNSCCGFPARHCVRMMANDLIFKFK